MRDKVNQNPQGGGPASRNSNTTSTNTRHSALFSEKGRILRNCLGATRLLGSDGDINQNNEKKQQQRDQQTTTRLFSITSSKNCSLNKTPSPIHIGDGALCSSKC